MSIEPALTAEQWNDLIENGYFITTAGSQHAHAARALYGQPFGFTWEDVGLLRSMGNRIEEFGELPYLGEMFDSLADRIAALLPPRAPSKVKEARWVTLMRD